MKPKIFCVGFNKTGTTSLNKIFKEQLDYNSVHKPGWTFWSVAPGESRINNYEAFTDGETPFLNNLSENYHNAFYILNTRPLRNWLLSRHKAIERSKAAMYLVIMKYVPIKVLAKYISNAFLSNSDKAILRWLKIRNSYHRFALKQFGRRENVLVLNIEDHNYPQELGSFLGLTKELLPEKTNKDGHGSRTKRMLESFGHKTSEGYSEKIIDAFLDRYDLRDHANCLTYFDNKDFNLSQSPADKFLKAFPFMKSAFQRAFIYFVKKRSQKLKIPRRLIFDFLISCFRSEENMNYFTSIHRFGSGSK